MGWSSWNAFGCNVNETVVKESANLFLSLNLSELGYKYVNIDDCWMARTRNDRSGEYQADALKFPSGMRALGEYIHSKGLLYGIYTSAGK